ncbi:hypothetical protein ONE63_011547 [Megalurothrips usitatus]|uniref:Reverse transcriptase domain-containing protein n=1 Tax=Megalurothrips usitatus TaxID=439358 RepID=A0AAV7X344_9NEOP|nr:hypothetical protein ONE63_011547 [Megalurothrips usitatus]
MSLRAIKEDCSIEVQELIKLALTERDVHDVLPQLDSYIMSIKRTETVQRKRKQRQKKKYKGSRSKRRAAEYVRYQQMYHKSPGQVADILISGREQNVTETPTVEEIEEFFEATYAENEPQWEPRSPANPPTINVSHPFSITEVMSAAGKIRETAAGPDGIKREDIRKMDDKDLTALMNIIWGLRTLPPILRRNRTVLLPKSGNLKDPKNWRPTTISSKLLRFLHSMINERLSSHVQHAYNQRGFVSQDGTLINNTVLQSVIKSHRENGKPILILSIDLAKAFDRVTKKSILDSLRRHQIDEHTIQYIMANYDAIFTTIECNGKTTREIKIKRGTKQGDPTSGLLFNLIIDDLLDELEEHCEGVKVGETRVKALAFADDLVLLAEDDKAMEEMTTITEEFLSHHNLEVNQSKCAALQLVRVPGTKKTAVQTAPLIRLYNQPIPTLAVDQQLKYLGLKYGHYGVKTPATSQIEEPLKRIKEAPLKPWQKLYIIQRHLIPTLFYGLQAMDVTKKKLRFLDNNIRKYIKEILHLPRQTADAYIHAPMKFGGLGIPSMMVSVPAIYLRRLNNLQANGQAKDLQACMKTTVITKLMERLKTMTSQIPSPSAQGVQKYWRNKMEICATGKALLTTRVESTWVYSPPWYWKNSEYTKAIQLRFGLLPTLSSSYRQVECRNLSCATQESLYHVLQRCPITHYARVNRHDSVAKAIVKALPARSGIECHTTPVIKMPIGTENQTPDLIFKDNDTAYIVEVTVCFESKTNSMQNSYMHKLAKYSKPEFTAQVQKQFKVNRVITMPYVIGCRGSWLPQNDAVCSILGINRRRHQRTTIESTLQWSISIHRIFGATVWRVAAPGHRKVPRLRAEEAPLILPSGHQPPTFYHMIVKPTYGRT